MSYEFIVINTSFSLSQPLRMKPMAVSTVMTVLKTMFTFYW
ncbi:hypothetical protein GARC_2539 [Paraglaciecola arctica BSs20135]|uniref:Uncharacterized protein n=1 Tax=Paraglaciecola arctica BSs20135 TaxID=493475 RepID=K6Z7T5_9ALTE|nr:hypothetical protein GARC_2539 [Paraglaciecola arctica BSs20135]